MTVSPPPLRAQLLAEIEAFLQAYGMHATNLGRDTIGDTALVSRLRAGKDIRTETVDKVRAYMQAYAARHRRRTRAKGLRQQRETSGHANTVPNHNTRDGEESC